jgi:hypothetical protein
MTKLTVKHIKSAISRDDRIDPEIEMDEPGKVIVWLRDGWTWNARDDNRSVEAFYISQRNADEQPIDTVAHWMRRLSDIEPALEA